jgi:hypothetical protein
MGIALLNVKWEGAIPLAKAISIQKNRVSTLAKASTV